MIQKLFVHDPDKRLGVDDEGFNNLKAHAFFKNIDFALIQEKKVKPPFVPRVKSETDTKYVDSEFTSEIPQDSPIKGGITDGNKGDTFEGIVITKSQAFHSIRTSKNKNN